MSIDKTWVDLDGDELRITTNNSGLGPLTIFVHQDVDLCGMVLQREQIIELRDSLTELLNAGKKRSPAKSP